jgi:hypothetical protein
MGVQQSSMMISLIVSQYLHDVMLQNPTLDVNYHSAMLEMITANARESIDVYRATANLEKINWKDGKALLKEY